MASQCTFFCSTCRKKTKHLHIDDAATELGTSRRTMYDWMERDWVHWRELASGRRMICEESLSHVGSSNGRGKKTEQNAKV